MKLKLFPKILIGLVFAGGTGFAAMKLLDTMPQPVKPEVGLPPAAVAASVAQPVQPQVQPVQPQVQPVQPEAVRPIEQPQTRHDAGISNLLK